MAEFSSKWLVSVPVDRHPTCTDETDERHSVRSVGPSIAPSEPSSRPPALPCDADSPPGSPVAPGPAAVPVAGSVPEAPEGREWEIYETRRNVMALPPEEKRGWRHEVVEALRQAEAGFSGDDRWRADLEHDEEVLRLILGPSRCLNCGKAAAPSRRWCEGCWAGPGATAGARP